MKALSTLTLFLFFFTFSLAEGSKDLNKSTDPFARRIFLSYANVGPSYGFYRLTQSDTLFAQSILYVYANVGDSICVASSALAVGIGSIRLTKPDGTSIVNYTTAPGDTGFIRPGLNSKLRENAGPFGLFNGDVANGYIPRVIVADQQGAWKIDFISPNPNTSNGQYHLSNMWPSGNTPGGLTPLASADFQQRLNNVLISAWDVTIIKNGAVQNGRLFSEYLELSAGQSAVSGTVGENKAELLAITREGFKYKVIINGMNGYGFSVFADNCGMQLLDGQTPAYQSTIANGGTNIPNLRIFNPRLESENEYETRHKIHFNALDPSIPATGLKNGVNVWLNPALIPSTSVSINYILNASPNPLTGYAFFNYPNFGIRYRLKLDLNQNNIFGDSGDYILSGVTVNGANQVPWNGLDSAGNPVSSSFCYDMKLEFLAGEFHFPLIDVEYLRQGLTIQRLNGSGTLPNDTIFWNDLPLNDLTNIDPLFVKQTPIQGSSSGAAQRRWQNATTYSPNIPAFIPTHTSSYGDGKFMDQWTLDTLESKIQSPFICFVILDLKYLDIQAKSYTANDAEIRWKVNELHSSGFFSVERQVGAGLFEKIAEIPFVVGKTSYSYLDSKAGFGKKYYRIVANYIGKKIASKVVETGGKANNLSLNLSPNPAHTTLTANIGGTLYGDKQTIRILNMNGMALQQITLRNQQNVNINISGLQQGMYIFEYQKNDDLPVRLKFIKAN